MVAWLTKGISEIGSPKKRSRETFSKNDILRRMEEDRERVSNLFPFFVEISVSEVNGLTLLS